LCYICFYKILEFIICYDILSFMNPSLAYLLGLIVGRGHIFHTQERVIIELAHKNEFLAGIAHCHKCNGLATERKAKNPNKDLFCKECGAKVSSSLKKSYNQPVETAQSIDSSIIPFLNLLGNLSFAVRGNSHMTFLVIDFKKEKSILSQLTTYLGGEINFDSFHIPEQFESESRDNKKEFITGIMDTASFPAAGGWLNRDGKNGLGRMRSYFQLVRNWHLPVELCNFLKRMSLPIHTIDWGHPNIRDSSMEDYYNSNPTSWSREHQLKFFPEYYKEFKMRLSHKNKLFKELIDHNELVLFDSMDDCDAPTTIGMSKVKPFHFGETDPRIPTPARCHVDSFWQVCHRMGCTYTNNKINDSSDKDAYYLAGMDKPTDFAKEARKRGRKSSALRSFIVSKHKKTASKAAAKITSTKKSSPESDLYEPISKWLRNELIKTKVNAKAHDTSSSYLYNFILKNNLHKDFELCQNYKIKPDIVGFDMTNHRLHFIEVKVDELTTKDIGQLLGYCLVANPETALLVSLKPPSINLIKILSPNSNVLKYDDNKSIQLGQWRDGNMEIFRL